MLNIDQVKQDIEQWMVNFVEVPHPALGNWAPCPYARSARRKKSYDVRVGVHPYCDLKNLGLSNLTGEQFFYNGKSNFSGWVSQKESFQEISISKKILINTAKLDDFNFENIDFIKIDVDSHEGFLLEGAK